MALNDLPMDWFFKLKIYSLEIRVKPLIKEKIPDLKPFMKAFNINKMEKYIFTHQQAILTLPQENVKVISSELKALALMVYARGKIAK